MPRSSPKHKKFAWISSEPLNQWNLGKGMKYDIILSGVGGQGVLSLSAITAFNAMRGGLHIKQSEIHCMAQRCSAFFLNLKLSDNEITSVTYFLKEPLQ